MDDVKNIVKQIKSAKSQNAYISYTNFRIFSGSHKRRFQNYICESYEKNIDYAEYISERIHNRISYSEYIAEKIIPK